MRTLTWCNYRIQPDDRGVRVHRGIPQLLLQDSVGGHGCGVKAMALDMIPTSSSMPRRAVLLWGERHALRPRNDRHDEVLPVLLLRDFIKQQLIPSSPCRLSKKPKHRGRNHHLFIRFVPDVLEDDIGRDRGEIGNLHRTSRNAECDPARKKSGWAWKAEAGQAFGITMPRVTTVARARDRSGGSRSQG